MYRLSKRERNALAGADRLNAILSQSSIKEASESARLRSKEQAAERLQDNRGISRRDIEALALKDALDSRSGPFEGVGIEAQMLNVLLDPNIPDSDPRKVLAKQRLGRPQTVTTPDGVFTTPGYNLGGDDTGTPDGFTPRKPTEREQTAAYTVANMRDFNSKATDYIPTFIESMAASATPSELAPIEAAMQSDQYKSYRNNAEQWTAAKVFLQSGATAREEEVQRDFRTLFPQFGDDDALVEEKRRAREMAMQNAEEAFLKRNTPRPGDEFLR